MKTLKRDRWFIFIVFFALTLFGLLMIYESSSIYAYKYTQDSSYFFKRQFIFFIISLIFFFLTLFLDLDFLKRYNKELLLLVIVCLLFLVSFGKSAGGARRWFNIGGFNIQPSEFLKVAFLCYCSDYLSRKKNLVRNFKSGILPMAIVLGIVCALVILQPDLGTAIFWVLWMILFLFIFGAKIKHLLSGISIGGLAFFFLIKLSSYRLARITSFLNPFSDPKGTGFQLIQSQIAYGSGGFFGVGLGQSRQKLFFLPASHTDFIYSIIAEEFGLLGSLGILIIFGIVFHKMFVIAKGAIDEFRAGILWGVLLIFFLEVFINIGVSCGVFPTKGLPLPFISYGGSSLVVHYILLALFFNASRKSQEKPFNQ
ncbi:MAG: putative lipid II flippase FtsW [Candidatus Omnitrophica bacterium]|nr:putative lipid II flippase FtsW [Candidatus Omnitrophota bacterium]